MEHLLQPTFLLFLLFFKSSFNPYFYGTSTSTQKRVEYDYRGIWFQSLFLWNIYFNPRNDEKSFCKVIGVSILIFMEHLLQRNPKKKYNRTIINVSILIFMEHLLQLESDSVLHQSSFRFQSLFLWNIYFNLMHTQNQGIIEGVSILIFMEHLLQLKTAYPTFYKNYRFQSLFLWNIYFNPSSSGSSIFLAFSFQSLFLWNIYFNQIQSYLEVLFVFHVSILIFMEHLLQQIGYTERQCRRK